MGGSQAEAAEQVTSFHDAITAARGNRAKGSTELAETLARWHNFVLLSSKETRVTTPSKEECQVMSSMV